MLIRILVEESRGDEELRSLYGWLSRDSETGGGRIGLTLVPRAEEPGGMGPLFEVVEAVFGNAVDLASLVVAVAAWRGTRPRRGQITFECEGVKVTLDGGDPAALEQVRRVLAELAERQG